MSAENFSSTLVDLIGKVALEACEPLLKEVRTLTEECKGSIPFQFQNFMNVLNTQIESNVSIKVLEYLGSASTEDAINYLVKKYLEKYLQSPDFEEFVKRVAESEIESAFENHRDDVECCVEDHLNSKLESDCLKEAVVEVLEKVNFSLKLHEH